MAKRSSETPAKQKAAKVPKLGPFQTKGKYDDEVTLIFDNGRALYVAMAFLKEASPVFKAMLENEYVEGKTGEIKLKTKSFDHFLDFLRLLHPQEYKPVNEENVTHIMSLADEYQIPIAKEACKVVIHRTMNTSTQPDCKEEMNRYPSYLSINHVESKELHVFTTLCTYLPYLSMYSYQDELNRAIEILSRFPFSMYIEHEDDSDSGTSYSPNSYEADRFDSIEAFAGLPFDLKGRILFQRLRTNIPRAEDDD